MHITLYPHNAIKTLKLYICLHGTLLELKIVKNGYINKVLFFA